nr:MAG TPA: hypothetical protein [Caudoviricetes sp.]
MPIMASTSSCVKVFAGDGSGPGAGFGLGLLIGSLI